MSKLYLPDGVRTQVWRLVKAQLRADPVLAQPPVELVFFEGDRESIAKVEDSPGPTIKFFATLGRMDWYTERSHSGALVITYETKVPDLDDEDVLNLQEALESVFYPGDGHAFQQALIAAGAVTGQARFVSPLNMPQSAARAGMLTPTGQIVIEVERPFPA